MLMLSTEGLIARAVQSSNKHVQQQDENGGEPHPPAEQRTVDEIQAAVPHPCHAAMVEVIRPAIFPGETEAQRRRRENRDVELEAARLAEVHEQAAHRKWQWPMRLPITPMYPPRT